MNKRKKISNVFLGVITICFLFSLMFPVTANAASTITGNNTMDTAYNYGSWSSINYNSGTAILEAGQTESWFQFTVAPSEHIYIRSSYDSDNAGEWMDVCDTFGDSLGNPQYTPANVYDPTSVIPSIYLDCDNNSTTTKTYYVVLHRGTVDINTNIYFTLSAYNRIRTGQGTFSFTGTASNPGNTSYSSAGVNSTILTLDLTRSTAIPAGAIVTKVSTASTQSPSQGNVHHMIMPTSINTWYTSTVSSATSGSYNISLSNHLLAAQPWSFRYNVLASAKSTMSNVKLTLSWQYDLNMTNYQIFTN